MQSRLPRGLGTVVLPGLFIVVLAAVPAPGDPPRFSDWSAPVNLGPIVNSNYSEAGAFLSRDGLTLYFGSTRPGGVGAVNTFDIWVSHRASLDDPWESPVNLGVPVNTLNNEQTPTLTLDGHRLYFARDGAGGYGSQDLYVSRRQRARDDFGWREPDNLGSGVNTTSEEAGPAVFEDDATGLLTLYFSSTRSTGLGFEDIYVATAYPNTPFGTAVLETALSGPFRDVRPFVRPGELEMYFDSNRPDSIGGSAVDLWTSRRATIWEPWSEPVRLPDTINSDAVDARPIVSFKGTELYFHSNRLGGLGGNDLYACTRTRIKGRGGH